MTPFVVVAAAMALMLVYYVTAVRRGRSRTRIGRDGFWLSTRGLRAGSRVSYVCLVGSRRHRGNLFIEPGPSEIFVYTGGAPHGIEIEVERSAAALGNDDDSDDSLVLGNDTTDDGGSSNYDTSSAFAESSAADAGSASDTSGGSAGSGESSAADAGEGFPPAY
jgi:hypothetical protein